MTLRNYKHVSVSSLGEATNILSTVNGKSVAIAGGTDLLGVLKDRIHSESPEVMIDLKTIQGLNYVKESETGLRIGALTTLTDICTNETIKEQYGMLAEAARSVASLQLRNMGTIGGNICQEPRCWYYRTPDDLFHCLRKGGTQCPALLGENRYHSIFGSVKMAQPACSETCPGSIEIPTYMDYVREGDLDSAAKIILASNPIPSITGRICPHLCESQCNRSVYDESVSIRNVERVVGDYILDNAKDLLASPEKELKESVAIVGAGPAGISAAYFLRKAGYQVTVYEKMPQAGGMLTYGIPADRLSKDVVNRQIDAFKAMGIEFKFDTAVGQDGVTLKDLQEKFTSVFLASGAWGERSLPLEKAELLTPGIDFLSSIELGKKPEVGKKYWSLEAATWLLMLLSQPVAWVPSKSPWCVLNPVIPCLLLKKKSKKRFMKALLLTHPLAQIKSLKAMAPFQGWKLSAAHPYLMKPDDLIQVLIILIQKRLKQIRLFWPLVRQLTFPTPWARWKITTAG